MIGSRLKITTVNIAVHEQEIKSVEIGGRTDIFRHKDVRHFIENRDGRIVQLEGEMKFKDNYFDFQVGYDDDFGRVKVRKKQEPTGNLQAVEEAFDFLDELFHDHFVGSE